MAMITRSSSINFALRDDEALYWVRLVQQWMVLCACIEKMEIWLGDTDPSLTHSQKDRATEK